MAEQKMNSIKFVGLENFYTIPQVYSGTEVPSDDLGKDGDIYIMYLAEETESE